MKKLSLLFLSLLLAVSASAVTPGSYNVLTLAITGKKQALTYKTNADGSQEATGTAASFGINNATVLNEAQRRGRIPTTAGYLLVSVSDDVGFLAIAAYNPGANSGVELTDFVTVDDGAVFTGKLKVDANGSPLAVSGSAVGAVVITLEIGADTYEIGASFTEKYSLKKNAAGANYVATAAATSSAVIGAGPDCTLAGKITQGASVPVVDLGAID